MDSDTDRRDQAAKDVASLARTAGEAVTQNGIQASHVQAKAKAVTSQVVTGVKSALPRKQNASLGTTAAHPKSSRSLALIYVGIAVAALLFIGACGPVLSPKSFNKEAGGIAAGLSNWAPLPQGTLLATLLGLIGLASVLKKPPKDEPGEFKIPAGVIVNDEGELCDNQGVPLPRGLRLSPDGKSLVVGLSGTPLPKGCTVGPGGVLLHASSGRPVPHSCRIGEDGELLSSTGEPLPASMSVGPNSTLVAADGTVLSPDLQPVPPGFNVSACGKLLLRPNGKPVPQGVHVGPGFRLLKPTGEHLPDGVKIGPCGTIICLDGTILGSDGHPTPRGFALNEDKTVIIDPEGSPIADTYSIGPNGTLISQSGELVTAVGKRRLPAHLTLGPVGNLLNSGTPVPAGTYFAAENIEELVLSADK